MSAPRRVLIVDDDAAIRDVLHVALSDQGYEVIEAGDGAAALSLLSTTPPDVILPDMRMPIMDGWEFAHTYSQLPEPRAPVIVVTAASNAAGRATEIKADSFLAKPFQLDDLYACVEQYAGRRGVARSGQSPIAIPMTAG